MKLAIILWGISLNGVLFGISIVEYALAPSAASAFFIGWAAAWSAYFMVKAKQ